MSKLPLAVPMANWDPTFDQRRNVKASLQMEVMYKLLQEYMNKYMR